MKQFVTEEEGDRDDKGRDSDARRAPCGESTPFLFARILIVLREIEVNLSPWNTKVFSVPAFSPSLHSSYPGHKQLAGTGRFSGFGVWDFVTGDLATGKSNCVTRTK